MPSCWQEAISTIYIMFSGRYRLTYEDKAMEAEDQLSRLLLQLDKREEGLRSSMTSLSQEAVKLKDKDRPRCKQKVQEYKRAQLQLSRLVQYKDMVSVHMDALRNTELNKTLITALQESSKTLKSMGVVEGVRQAELVVSDVEASMAQAQEMTAILNAPMTTNITVTDEDLDAELGLLLEEEEESITIPIERHCASASPAMPSGEKASVNKMSKIEEEEEAMV
jgi:hypothetical protein